MRSRKIFLLLLICGITLFAHSQNDTMTFFRWTLSCPDPNDTAFMASMEATVPGCIHTDLLRHGLIPDPYYATNEQQLQWVSETQCSYTTDFWRSELPAKKNIELVLQGVTGYAEIFLNGEPLNHQDGNNVMDNAYRTWRFFLDKKVRNYNFLEIRFTPSQTIINQRKAQVPYALPDERAFLRMPPYQAGWDWGPKLTTYGITGGAYIIHYPIFDLISPYIFIEPFNIGQVRRRNVLGWVYPTVCRTTDCILRDAKKSGHVSGKIHVDGHKWRLTRGRGFNSRRISVSEGNFDVFYGAWIPNSMPRKSSEPLRDLKITAKSGLRKQTERFRVGYRTVELRQTPDSIGKSFTFVINGEPVFVKGANWIPADFFPHNMTAERYRELLQACKYANINMIRVWGGGLYEPDIFYDLCDEMGIMVWQDFMFSCALYPGDSAFLANVRQEAIEQVLRLRRHPCIVVWCGNNEVKNGWEDWGWQSDFAPEYRAAIDYDLHYLFDTLLNNIVSSFCPGTPYVATSPLWGWGHKECCTEGDSHYWGVWWGEQPFEVWYDKTGRFMSEFGFQSYPDMRTIESFAPVNERYLGSPSLNSHQKHARGVQIIDKAMEQYFYRPENLEDYAYVSQLVQAFGTGMALEEHRRRMPYCMGTLFWQLNDCWPVASWSCIDYYGRRKALYYEAKRQFAPVILATDTMHGNRLPISLVTDYCFTQNARLELTLRDFSGNVLDVQIVDSLLVKENNSCQIANYDWPSTLDSTLKTSTYLQMRLWSYDSWLLAEKCYFFAYPGQLNLKSDEITIKKVDKNILEISCPTLQYGVELSADQEVTFDDNYFVLEPGETKAVSFTTKSAETNIRFSARSFGR